MPTFRYEGFNKDGKAKQGQIEAGSESDASARCRDAGLFLNRLEPVDGNPMKTVLHHRTEEDDFLDTSPEDMPARVYEPDEGQNYPRPARPKMQEPEPDWQPSWRKPAPGVAKKEDDTQNLAEWQITLAGKIHEIAEFYQDCLTVIGNRSGPFPEMMKTALNKETSDLIQNAVHNAWTDPKPEETKKPSNKARLDMKESWKREREAAERFAKEVVIRGEAVPAGTELPCGATHVIVNDDAEHPVVRRNRFSIA